MQNKHTNFRTSNFFCEIYQILARIKNFGSDIVAPREMNMYFALCYI